MTDPAAVILRPGRIGDAAACAAILDRWIDDTPWMPRLHGPEAIEAHYREVVIPRRRMFIAEIGGAVAGYLAVDEAEDEITSLYTAAPGAGVGRVLLAAAKSGRAQLSLWTFQANERARRFYRREGFREGAMTPGENEEGLPDVQFRWASAAEVRG